MSATILNVRNPRWSAPNNGSLDVDVDAEGIGDNLPFTVPQDSQLYTDAIAGRFGTIQPFVPPDIDYAPMIDRIMRQKIEGPYVAKRESANNYHNQLNTLKIGGVLTQDQQNDLDGLMAASSWEQAMLDKGADLIKTPTKASFDAAMSDATWPPFPAAAVSVVATC